MLCPTPCQPCRCLSPHTPLCRSHISLPQFLLLAAFALRLYEDLRNRRTLLLCEIPPSTTRVVRGGVEERVPIDAIVPGDLVVLSAGDVTPGNVRVLAACDLFIS